MLAIEAASVVDGDVVGDNLILTKHDATTIDAGNVRGAAGTNGTNGVNAPAVRAASPGSNVASLSGTFTLDGVSLAVGDRVLLMNQTAASQNGVYVVAAGAWSRATDLDTSVEMAGQIVLVREGTLRGGKRFVTSFKATDTIGSTNMSWAEVTDAFNGPVIISISGTTDSSGFLIVTHGLGFTPSFVTVMNGNPSTNFPVMWGVDSIGGTTFRVRFMNASTAGAANAIATGPQKALCFR
jgi:hypothetical protein